MNKILITTIILLAFLGCNTKKEKTGQQKKVKPIADGELLTFSDSLQIKLPDKLTFIESYEDRLLFHAGRYGIVLTDLSGKVIYDFNPVGEAENEVGYQMKQICFTDDGNIAIASERGISNYTIKGDFLHRMDQKFPYNSVEKNMLSFVDNDQHFYLTNILIEPENFSVNMSVEEYYETMHLKMLHNYEEQKSWHMLGLPKSSVFKSLEQYYSRLYANITLSKQNELFGVVFNPERKLYLYNLDRKLTEKGAIHLDPPNFKRPFTQPIEYGRADRDLIHKSIKCNSTMMNMTSIGDFVYINYRPGLPVDQSEISFEEANDSYEKYILKVDLVNKKHVASYKLPYEVYQLQGSFNNQLVFSSKTEGYDYETFYLIDAP